MCKYMLTQSQNDCIIFILTQSQNVNCFERKQDTYCFPGEKGMRAKINRRITMKKRNLLKGRKEILCKNPCL